MSIDIGGMRTPYLHESNTFDVKDLLSKEPFGHFEAWFEEASRSKEIEEPNAMCLATATASGIPSARMMLLKEFGKEGFVFYTNVDSRKAKELDENAKASLVFYWEPFKRSVRVEGTVEKVPDDKAEAYFHTRPFYSKIGAVVSAQSKVIKDRDEMVWKARQLKDELKEKSVPKPDSWGGYRVIPEVFEFWQGQTNRLHDRLRFRVATKGEDVSLCVQGDDGWIIERLGA